MTIPEDPAFSIPHFDLFSEAYFQGTTVNAEGYAHVHFFGFSGKMRKTGRGGCKTTVSQ